MKVMHITTVDLSLKFLVRPQLLSIVELGGEAIGVSAPGPWVEDLKADGIRHIALEASTRGAAPLQDLLAARQFWRVLRNERPDVLHTHNPKPGFYGRLLGRIARVPIVVNTVHGLYATPDDPLMKRALVYALEGIASRFSDAELVQSSEDLALLQRWRIVPPSKARLLGNGVDLQRFDPDRPGLRTRDSLRAELGIAEGQIVVGIVGRLVEEKGFLELFAAANHLDPRYVLVVVGPTDDAKGDALTSEVISAARADGVRFLGMRTDVDELYRAMDIFVLPSHREGFPRAAMEAAAMGLPVVASDIRGCREVVDDGVNGLLFPVRDEVALAAAITQLGEDDAARAGMGEAGRRKARLAFDEELIVATVLDTYRRVANHKGLARMIGELSAGDDPPRIRRSTLADARTIARLHMESISSGFLARLGINFLTTLYRALISWPGGLVLVADAWAGPVGFVAGVADTRAFYKAFLLRHSVPAVLAALPALVRPSNARRAWETLAYGGTGGAGPSAKAELLAMAVAPKWRGQNLGYSLGKEFLEELQIAGASPVKVVVGATNNIAISAYEKMGFVDAGSTEVHGSETSQVLVWSA